MQIRPISRVMTATALTNPDPSFVSLCGGPANQTPFHAVRSDDSINAVVTPEEDMKIKRSKAASAVVVAQKGFSVMQLAFNKNTFKTAEEVTAWLEDGGYQSYAITETSKSFEVSDESGTKFEVGTTQKIKDAAPGVTAYVGQLAGSTEDDQIVEDADVTEVVTKTEVVARERVRSGEPVEPAEPVAVEPAAAVVVEPVAKAEEPNNDDVQPVAEIDAELRAKIDAILAAHPITVTKGVGCYSVTRVVEVVSQLRYLIDDADYTDFDEATIANLKSAAVSALSALSSVVSQFSSEMGKVFRTDPTVTIQRSEETQEAEPAPVVEAEPAPAGIDAALVAKMIEDAVAPLSTKLTAAETEASEARARAEQAESDLAARVEADASQTQTRKAADELDPPANTTTTQKDADIPLAKRSRAAGRLLESFGSRHSR